MACGRPVVRIRSRDTYPVVDGETGLLVEPEVRSVSEALSGLVNRKEWLAAMGQRARAVIEKEYNLNTVLAKTEDVYRRCLS